MRAAAPRWAISFADLGLVLLGCFVMLHAIEAARPRVDAAAAPQASAAPSPMAAEFAAAELFETGEARLTPAGRARLRAVGHQSGETGLTVVSRGLGERGQRLDRFELAAARAAATARALAEGGAPEARLAIRLDETRPQDAGQHIVVERRR